MGKMNLQRAQFLERLLYLLIKFMNSIKVVMRVLIHVHAVYNNDILDT